MEMIKVAMIMLVFTFSSLSYGYEIRSGDQNTDIFLKISKDEENSRLVNHFKVQSCFTFDEDVCRDVGRYGVSLGALTRSKNGKYGRATLTAFGELAALFTIINITTGLTIEFLSSTFGIKTVAVKNLITNFISSGTSIMSTIPIILFESLNPLHQIKMGRDLGKVIKAVKDNKIIYVQNITKVRNNIYQILKKGNFKESEKINVSDDLFEIHQNQAIGMSDIYLKFIKNSDGETFDIERCYINTTYGCKKIIEDLSEREIKGKRLEEIFHTFTSGLVLTAAGSIHGVVFSKLAAAFAPAKNIDIYKVGVAATYSNHINTSNFFIAAADKLKNWSPATHLKPVISLSELVDNKLGEALYIRDIYEMEAMLLEYFSN